MTAVQAFGELVSLAETSVGAARVLRAFLDQNPVLNEIEVDSRPASGGGTVHRFLSHKPTQGLLSALAAARAENVDGRDYK